MTQMFSFYRKLARKTFSSDILIFLFSLVFGLKISIYTDSLTLKLLMKSPVLVQYSGNNHFSQTIFRTQTQAFKIRKLFTQYVNDIS